MKPVIRFENVGKRYNLQRGGARALRDLFTGRRAPKLVTGDRPGTLWAVRGVSFEITPGETVGLVGPNGAGKSTSLKLISRVIFPNEGRVAVEGRVAALLELGTGFHPDLSGRDNVFLSGALLGIGRREMQRKFDSIVEFSELEEFIDVPVKYYSSGMFARLAFAVSIHVEPEILLVDEVLAVGDQNFQQKCMDRIRELQRQGVTICLVTHALETVRTLCTRALWFQHGRLESDGLADPTVTHYVQSAAREDMARRGVVAQEQVEQANRWGTRRVEIRSVRLTDAAGRPHDVFETGAPMVVELDYFAPEPTASVIFGLAITRQDGVHICGPNTQFAGMELPPVREGSIAYRIDRLPVLDGLYTVTAAVVSADDTETYDYHDRLYPFRVVNPGHETSERYGAVTFWGRWDHRPAV